MSEKLTSTSGQAKVERAPSQVAEQFHIDSDNYPIFSRQAVHEYDGSKTLSIDETLGIYVRNTADLISTIDGTGEDIENPPIDHVIYLDKSARPVSWLVNTFWSDFSDSKRPEHSYLAIDRQPWMKYAGVELGVGEYIKDTGELAEPRHFDIGKIPDEFIARIRAIYLDSGLPEEVDSLFDIPDPSKTTMSDDVIKHIMQAPTNLEGKNILIVDEVERSGSTLYIASELIKRAVPEVKGVYTAYFVPGVDNPNPKTLQRFTPVWYDHDFHEGRGIGDIDPKTAIERYKSYKESGYEVSPRYRARVLGSFALGTYYDLSQETGSRKSRDVMNEIKKMHQDFEDGKILMRPPRHYNFDRYEDYFGSLGVRFAPETDHSPDTYINIASEQESRRTH